MTQELIKTRPEDKQWMDGYKAALQAMVRIDKYHVEAGFKPVTNKWWAKFMELTDSLAFAGLGDTNPARDALIVYIAELVAQPEEYFDVVLKQVEDSPDMMFVEIEDKNGYSIDMGKWVKRPDGYQVIRIPTTPHDPCPVDGVTPPTGEVK
jgi:formylglycine-generating enzyme required for sulfatase activity